jgi:hypothetical protein
MTVGHIRSTLAISTPLARLGIVVDKLSAWLFVPDSVMGCSISWCVSNPKTIASLDAPLFRSVLEYLDQPWRSLYLQKPVEVLVFEEPARPPNSDSPIWSLDGGLRCIITSRGLRSRLPIGWQAESRFIVHAALGGVSSWPGMFKIYTRILCQVMFFRDEGFIGAPSFLANLTSDVVSGKPCKSPSDAEFDATPQLLPVADLFFPKPWPRFKLASVFTPTKFCRRKLTVQESLVAAHIPLDLVSSLSQHQQYVLLSLMHCPVKIVLALAQCCPKKFHWGGRFVAQFKTCSKFLSC